ncbi:hypothetical protein HK102_004750 [Quaeritorhiza haematococci]|nr:hypothetical protein HK102_004750 [Quaeritorhiza haematococci]
MVGGQHLLLLLLSIAIMFGVVPDASSMGIASFGENFPDGSVDSHESPKRAFPRTTSMPSPMAPTSTAAAAATSLMTRMVIHESPKRAFPRTTSMPTPMAPTSTAAAAAPSPMTRIVILTWTSSGTRPGAAFSFKMRPRDTKGPRSQAHCSCIATVICHRSIRSPYNDDLLGVSQIVSFAYNGGLKICTGILTKGKYLVLYFLAERMCLSPLAMSDLTAHSSPSVDGRILASRGSTLQNATMPDNPRERNSPALAISSCLGGKEIKLVNTKGPQVPTSLSSSPPSHPSNFSSFPPTAPIPITIPSLSTSIARRHPTASATLRQAALPSQRSSMQRRLHGNIRINTTPAYTTTTEEVVGNTGTSPLTASRVEAFGVMKPAMDAPQVSPVSTVGQSSTSFVRVPFGLVRSKLSANESKSSPTSSQQPSAAPNVGTEAEETPLLRKTGKNRSPSATVPRVPSTITSNGVAEGAFVWKVKNQRAATQSNMGMVAPNKSSPTLHVKSILALPSPTALHLTASIVDSPEEDRKPETGLTPVAKIDKNSTREAQTLDSGLPSLRKHQEASIRASTFGPLNPGRPENSTSTGSPAAGASAITASVPASEPAPASPVIGDAKNPLAETEKSRKEFPRAAITKSHSIADALLSSSPVMHARPVPHASASSRSTTVHPISLADKEVADPQERPVLGRHSATRDQDGWFRRRGATPKAETAQPVAAIVPQCENESERGVASYMDVKGDQNSCHRVGAPDALALHSSSVTLSMLGHEQTGSGGWRTSPFISDDSVDDDNNNVVMVTPQVETMAVGSIRGRLALLRLDDISDTHSTRTNHSHPNQPHPAPSPSSRAHSIAQRSRQMVHVQQVLQRRAITMDWTAAPGGVTSILGVRKREDCDVGGRETKKPGLEGKTGLATSVATIRSITATGLLCAPRSSSTAYGVKMEKSSLTIADNGMAVKESDGTAAPADVLLLLSKGDKSSVESPIVSTSGDPATATPASSSSSTPTAVLTVMSTNTSPRVSSETTVTLATVEVEARDKGKQCAVLGDNDVSVASTFNHRAGGCSPSSTIPIASTQSTSTSMASHAANSEAAAGMRCQGLEYLGDVCAGEVAAHKDRSRDTSAPTVISSSFSGPNKADRSINKPDNSTATNVGDASAGAGAKIIGLSPTVLGSAEDATTMERHGNIVDSAQRNQNKIPIGVQSTRSPSTAMPCASVVNATNMPARAHPQEAHNGKGKKRMEAGEEPVVFVKATDIPSSSSPAMPMPFTLSQPLMSSTQSTLEQTPTDVRMKTGEDDTGTARLGCLADTCTLIRSQVYDGDGAVRVEGTHATVTPMEYVEFPANTAAAPISSVDQASSSNADKDAAIAGLLSLGDSGDIAMQNGVRLVDAVDSQQQQEEVEDKVGAVQDPSESSIDSSDEEEEREEDEHQARLFREIFGSDSDEEDEDDKSHVSLSFSSDEDDDEPEAAGEQGNSDEHATNHEDANPPQTSTPPTTPLVSTSSLPTPPPEPEGLCPMEGINPSSASFNEAARLFWLTRGVPMEDPVNDQSSSANAGWPSQHQPDPVQQVLDALNAIRPPGMAPITAPQLLEALACLRSLEEAARARAKSRDPRLRKRAAEAEAEEQEKGMSVGGDEDAGPVNRKRRI